MNSWHSLLFCILLSFSVSSSMSHLCDWKGFKETNPMHSFVWHHLCNQQSNINYKAHTMEISVSYKLNISLLRRSVFENLELWTLSYVQNRFIRHLQWLVIHEWVQLIYASLHSSTFDYVVPYHCMNLKPKCKNTFPRLFLRHKNGYWQHV